MDWNDFESEVRQLAGKIEPKPDFIIGITRGGMIPARLLSTYLNVKDVHCVSVRKRDGERHIVTDIQEGLEGKSVLLVEDMLETGRSLIVAKRHLEAKGAVVKTACLYTMPASEIIPDYYLKQVNGVEIFPWESE